MTENSAKRIADAITANASASSDAAGVHVSSLTEAVMGITAGLVKIADAIDRLASAVEDGIVIHAHIKPIPTPTPEQPRVVPDP